MYEKGIYNQGSMDSLKGRGAVDTSLDMKREVNNPQEKYVVRWFMERFGAML